MESSTFGAQRSLSSRFTTNMKILYFHQHFTTPQGSTGTRSYEMSRRLVKRGHEVTIVCGSYAMAKSGVDTPIKRGMRVGMVDGIRVMEICLPYSNHDSLLKRSTTFLRYAWRSVRIALKEDYDLLFATSTPLTAGIPGIVMKFFRKKIFIFEVRDLWPELPREMGVIKNPVILAAMSFLEWLSYRKADACIGLSPGIVEGIKRRAPTGRSVAMVPNGCDLDLFRPGKREDLDLADVKKEDFVAVFSGAHGMANGLGAVLDAAAVLKKRARADIKLIFIGDGKVKPGLIRQAAEKRLDNCLFFDPVPKDRLNGILASADAGMMILANIPAFYYGTSPNKFFDYIASGLPVINNYPGWLRDLIREHGCGFAVGPSDPEAFADAMIAMADDPEETRRMGEKARLLAETTFSRDVLAEQFCAFLEERDGSRLKRRVQRSATV